MSGYKIDGDDLLVFQTPAEALAKHKPGFQTPQTTGGSKGSGFYQPHYSFQNWSGSSSPSSSDVSFERLLVQSPQQQQPQPQVQPQPQPQHQQPKALSQKERLRQFFDCCDFNRDGRLGEEELSHALRNYDQSEFKRSTARTMIKLFDKNHFNLVDFDDFCNIWNYLARWRTVFEKCDLDLSLSINHGEFKNALKTFGFELPNESVNHVFFTFLTLSNGQPLMKFDSFIESMVWIMKVTEVFKHYPSTDGTKAEIGYFDFIDVLLAFRD